MPDEPLAKRLKVEVDQLKADAAKQEADDAKLAAEVASIKAELHAFLKTTKTNLDAGMVSLSTRCLYCIGSAQRCAARH